MDLQVTGQHQGFWSLLADDERAALSALGRVGVYSPGAVMAVEGEPAAHVFVVTDGWVKIVSVARDGTERVLALRGQGDVVGEHAQEAAGYRTATVRAIGTVRALLVAYEDFSAFLDSSPGAGSAYRRVITQRWTDAESMLRSRLMSTGAQRLARLLLDLAGEDSSLDREVQVVMPLSQEELASLAGASRATVTRVISSWRQRGIIRTSFREITITDPAALRLIAGPAVDTG